MFFNNKLWYNYTGDMMTIIDIIEKKKNKKELTHEEISYVIKGMLDKTIEDYQISSLLMAIVLNGMTLQETIYLTDEMLNSGDKIDLSSIDGIIVDKHSTGGVGDKVTLILAPLLASLGIKIAKMSGRGLGHTGGTIDKLESIPGYKVELSREEFIKQVNDIGISIISQSGNIVPADKKLYALRDVTGTVDSIPLIASSIMSKKIASGADLIFIDVKVGNGALMNNLEDAKKLASTMIEIGKEFNKIVICILTDMNEPLGYAIGNSLEVKEAIESLNGYGPKDVMELIVSIASLVLNKTKNISLDEARNMCMKKLTNGEAYDKFKQLVRCQHGNLDELKISDKIFSVKSPRAGYISKINALALGEIARVIGAGRLTKDDVIDPTVGLVLTHKTGDYVNENEELIKVYLNKLDVKLEDILNCFEFSDEKVEEIPLIYEIMS